ncbi:MAG: ABC transporter ATP-binding protein/permease [Calothrix sp. FI2-JRJ7]|nr:ABC transporter ATP-binding protein/permease [Calothrix sp. FI2-JRJ7]
MTFISPPDRKNLLPFFFSFLYKYWSKVILLVLSLIFQLAFELLLPFIYQLIFDRVISTRDSNLLLILLSVLVVAYIIFSLASLIQDYFSTLIGAGVIKDISIAMFKHLQHLCLSFYAGITVGELMSRFSSNLNDVERVVTIDFPKSIYNIFLGIASTLLLFAVEWRLALVTVIASPIVLIGPNVFGSKVSKSSYKLRQEEANVLSKIQENISAQAMIRSFGLQKSEIFKFQEQAAVLSLSSKNSNFFNLLIGRLSLLSIYFLQILIIAVGAFLAIRGALTAGSLVGFISLLFNMNVAIDGLTQQFPSLVKATSGLIRIKELLSKQATITDTAEAITLPPLAQGIRFNNVSFSYSGTQPNVNKISFKIQAGQSVAFVGLSGSGKSTLLNLLMRFYDPNEGSVIIDGHDIRQVTQASLRSQIGVVFQETFLFNTTIRENICLGKLDATDAEIEAAAKAAEIHESILTFPQKYDTIVGERGGKLSGGQRQRIAIARAILRNPAILILDEATSSLDAETEFAINATLRKLAKGRTVISVTHRLASIMDSNCIFVLKGGRIIEQGNHTQLLYLQGLYSQLWWKQKEIYKKQS